jgi:hypothetical protein
MTRYDGTHRRNTTMTQFEERSTMTIQHFDHGRTETLAEQLADVPNSGPRPLPYSAYPKASDVARHGVQPLPASLPLVDFAQAKPYRSSHYTAVPADRLTPAQVLQMARVVAASFARREPQSRHLRPPKYPPAGLMEARHTDPFGTDAFGPWTTETLLYWLIRLLLLTDPTAPRSAVEVNEEVLAQSLAIVDEKGQVMGGAFNETMPPLDVIPEFREDNPFLAAALEFVEPVLVLLGTQDAEALTALGERYPAFGEAYEQGKVGHHFMVARSDALAKEDAFELVAASAEHYRELGYEYMVIEATNQWTGAACEALGGARVHFAPFQAEPAVRKSAEPVEGAVTSPDGFVAGKDSGSMFYAIRLA